MSKSPIRLSQCMIVKNEEENIERALSWGKDIVCEQIIVDTGSTDRTVEIAKKMGAKVLHFQWIDDFSAAKNYAIEQASGNWIAFLDADEYLSQEDARKLMEILEKIHSYEEVDVVRAKLVNLLDDTGLKAGNVTCQDRVFRNDPKLRYRYRIHERLEHAEKKKLMGYNAQELLLILHTGYGKHIDRAQKSARNIKLLEQDAARFEKDALLSMYLGDSYDFDGNKEKALACYRRALWEEGMESELDTAFIQSGLQIMKLRMREPAEDIQDEFHQIEEYFRKHGWNKHPDLDYYMGRLYHKAGQLGKAVVRFERALEKLELYTGKEGYSILAKLEYPNTVVAADAMKHGDYRKTVRYAVAALRANKYYADALILLMAAFKTEYREKGNAESYWETLCNLYDTDNLKDLIFLYQFSKGTQFHALAEKAWALLPAEAKEYIGIQK